MADKTLEELKAEMVAAFGDYYAALKSDAYRDAALCPFHGPHDAYDVAADLATAYYEALKAQEKTDD